jgi:hypothetical protein
MTKLTNQWTHISQVAEVPVNLSLICMLIKKWLKKEPYHVTLSFYAKSNSSTELTGTQIEYGRTNKTTT